MSPSKNNNVLEIGGSSNFGFCLQTKRVSIITYRGWKTYLQRNPIKVDVKHTSRKLFYFLKFRQLFKIDYFSRNKFEYLTVERETRWAYKL